MGLAGASATPSLAITFAVWCLMMAAMMLPATLPWVLAFSRMTGGTGPERARRTGLFLAGYALVWGAYAGGTSVLQVGLHRGGVLIGGGTLPVALGGAVLVAAGLFQLSAFKQACLSQCRSPLSFFLSRWRDGPIGALRMGTAHGSHCVGCCWAIMAAGFALGVMNLAWMAVLTAVMWAEKLVPGGPRIGRIAGWVGIVAGAWMMVFP